jgi:hypothetical protein
MKKYNLLSIILLGIAVSNCGGKKKGENSLFNFDTSKFSAKYQPQEALTLAILNPDSKKVDSIIYYVNDQKIASKKELDKLTF